MSVVGIIPVRMASSRFPGKPLAKILGIPMVGHVYYRSKMSKMLDEVYIATCDEDIAQYAESIGAPYVMTKDTHQRASDRTAEAMLKIEKKNKKRLKIVVMIQGDEPMLVPEMISDAVKPLMKDKNINVSNLMGTLKSKKEEDDPNSIKVVVDKKNSALYFSRQPIPYLRKDVKLSISRYKQVCIIPFRRDFLLQFNNLESTPLEKAESVDMLRVLENGYKVQMVPSDYPTYSVDTIQDLRLVERLMRNDRLMARYR